VLFSNRKSNKGFLLVSKVVTLNDFERRNSRYFVLFHRIMQTRGPISCVKVVET